MSTYYVDGGNAGNDSNNGQSNTPWKTLAKALSRVANGDTVLVRSAVYHEVLSIRTPNTTWKADTGHTPVIDGRYNESKKGQGPAGTLPGNKNAGMISLRAEGITIDGFTIRYIGGCGINGTGCSNATIRNCRIHFTYVSSIKISPVGLIDDVLIENNVCTRAGMQSFDATATGGKDPGGGVIKVGRTRDGIIRGNVCAMSYGEGINIGKGNLGFICEDNEIFLVSHKHIYVNRSQDVIVRNNVVWFTPGHPDIEADGDAPGAIGIGDECGNRGGDSLSSCRNNSAWPKSKRVQIYNNLVVGLGELCFVTNGAGNEQGGGYDTTLEECYIGYNTFVAGPRTKSGVKLGANQKGHPHVRSIFENNLIDWRFAPNSATITAGNGDLQGIGRRNNLWSVAPPERFRGPGDQHGNPQLVQANAPITASLDNNLVLRHNFNANNYKLTNNSALAINHASNGQAYNGLTPPNITRDFFVAPRSNQRDIGAHEYGAVTIILEANFGIDPDEQSGEVPHTVHFIDSSIATEGIASWRWNFGDGGTSTEQEPDHVYMVADDYTVSLTIRDNRGQEDIETKENFIEALPEVVPPDEIDIPVNFRRFLLMTNVNEEKRVHACGAQFPDLRCVLVWSDAPHHMSSYDSIDDIETVHGENDERYIEWIDPEPVVPEEILLPATPVITPEWIAEPV